jgi:hypothetical protein
VPEGERYEAEARITDELREKFPLFNVKNGNKHTPESLRRIAEGKRRARESRGEACTTGPTVTPAHCVAQSS